MGQNTLKYERNNTLDIKQETFCDLKYPNLFSAI